MNHVSCIGYLGMVIKVVYTTEISYVYIIVFTVVCVDKSCEEGQRRMRSQRQAGCWKQISE